MRAAPYLITSLNAMPGADRWVRTAQAALGDAVQPVIIMWEPYFEVSARFLVRRMGRPYPGHMAKLLPLLEMDLDRDRWFLFTDGADVAFQAPLPDLDASGRSVLLANEGVTHGESAFWRPHLELSLYAGLKDRPIYNVGTWAAVGDVFLDFLRYLAAARDLCRRRGWPLVDVHEQLIYNLWVQAAGGACGEMDTLFCSLYANVTGPRMDGGGAAALAGGHFVNRRGEPYVVVHGNGGTKALLDAHMPPAGTPAPADPCALRTGE